MVTKTCKFCNQTKEYEKWQGFAGHVTNCSENPNKGDGFRKYAIQRLAKNPITEFHLICTKCKSPYSLSMRIQTYNRGAYRKFCSSVCNHSRTKSVETRKKLSDAFAKKRIIKYCSCGCKIKRTSKHCAKCKYTDEFRKKISISNKGKTGGYRVKSGTSKFHGSYYREVWMDSGWEVRMAKRLDALGIEWERSSQVVIPYTLNGKNRKYYPDFYLKDYDRYIEVKGYLTQATIDKMEAVLSQNKIDLVTLRSEREIDEWIL